MSASLPVYDIKKKKVGDVDLAPELFTAEVDWNFLSEMTRLYQAKRKSLKTGHTKTRSEIVGTTKKVYRQKGTGQARHGSEKAPIYVGGGKAHGPRVHVTAVKVNKQQKRKALIQALSLMQKEDRIFVIDSMEQETPRTKDVVTMLSIFDAKKSLVVNIDKTETTENFNKGVRNIQKSTVCTPDRLSFYNLLETDGHVFLSKTAYEELVARLKGGKND